MLRSPDTRLGSFPPPQDGNPIFREIVTYVESLELFECPVDENVVLI